MSLFPCRCPEGYTIRELKPEHAEFIAHHWTHFTDYPNRTAMFKECIQRFGSAAAFSDDNDTQPVSWIMLYAFMSFGHFFTIDNHRRKGLGLAVMAALCRSVKQQLSITPFLSRIEGESIPQLAEKLGFLCGKEVDCSIEIDSTDNC